MSDRGVEFPEAVYLDANVLISLPHHLQVPELLSLREVADQVGTTLFVPELAVNEWMEHRVFEASAHIARMRTASETLGSMLKRRPLEFEDLSDQDLGRDVRQAMRVRLESAGLQVVATPRLDVAELCRLFVEKAPPFGAGDKGFKDAVIIETILRHAAQERGFRRIVVGSSDSKFGHAEIAERFSESGVALEVVGGKPKHVIARTVSYLREKMEAAGRHFEAQRTEALTRFLREQEVQVFDYVNRFADTGYAWLFDRSRIADPDSPEDERLWQAGNARVDLVRPMEILSAQLSEQDPHGRYFFVCRVKVECDLTTWTVVPVFVDLDETMKGTFSTCASSTFNAQAFCTPGTYVSGWRPAATATERLTVRRILNVAGTVRADDGPGGPFSDLGLEGGAS